MLSLARHVSREQGTGGQALGPIAALPESTGGTELLEHDAIQSSIPLFDSTPRVYSATTSRIDPQPLKP